MQSLHEYVLAPLLTAAARVDREQTEVAAERDAFAAFRDQVADVDSARPGTSQRCIATSKRDSAALERVWAAYRETVTGVAHYERVYGESAAEHAAFELGSSVAERLRDRRSATFTPAVKRAVLVAAQRAVDDRRALLARLDAEASSLDGAREGLGDLLEPLSSAVVPEWHRESFVRQLDAIAERRQNRLRERSDTTDGEKFYLIDHLYNDGTWTFPVLTGVARVQEAVTFGSTIDNSSATPPRETPSDGAEPCP
ncbi:DUF7260 family protein [Halobacterium hubeiense]|uniref:DUF7260 family protein n=1 Tax=Halobacterium hubeiense TaxID=1407499 RepID=UPI003C774399